MKVEINIDEEELRQLVLNRLQDRIMNELWEESYDYGVSSEERKRNTIAKRQKILNQIDWKNAGKLLSDAVIQKFFMHMIDNHDKESRR